MKKYERIKDTYMVFAIFGIKFVFGTVLEFFFSKFSKKDHFQKVNIEKQY